MLKYIETCIGNYIPTQYGDAIEVGIGNNFEAGKIILRSGCSFRCTDIKPVIVPSDFRFYQDDIYSPSLELYHEADVIYSIRPAVEMISPLISLAQIINCDLLVYHLGFESYDGWKNIIECGVTLHQYH